MIKNIWNKIKSIKHFEILLAIFVGLVVCAVYFFCLSPSKSDTKKELSTEEYSSAMEYADKLENKLCNVLEQIDGVEDVDVVITLESGFTYEYATDNETKTTVSGDVTTTINTETIILVSNQPIVIKEIYPNIKGVVVVAKGAKNFSIKMNIITAVETVLEINRENITVLS
ncbi:MAG: hypothetical protein E7375_01820 [Clostridiales bacterium]|nr:hypothetical protein [Clostridiales bacterium]